MAEMRTTKVFADLVDAWADHPRYICEEGGARSSKTYSITQLLHLIARSHPGIVVSAVAETMPQLRRGAVRDFEGVLTDLGEWEPERWNKVECIYRYPNGALFEFFSADQPGKVLGPGRDILWLNEAINIAWEVARQLIIRTRQRIVMDYNPARAFWAHEKIQPRANCRTLRSTYLDNPFLPPEQVAEIESNKDDPQWWRVYGLGLVGKLSGLVYSFEQIDELPDATKLREFYGLDFGFTHDPTACVHILADTGRKALYVDEVIYSAGLLNKDIIARLAGIPRALPIYADCAEPKSIEEIRRAGFHVVPSNKGAPSRSDRLRFQIQWLQGWSLHVTKRSTNIIRELRNYTWATDTDGHPLDYPIDKYNHALDALRYGAWTHLAGGKGQYTIHIR